MMSPSSRRSRSHRYFHRWRRHQTPIVSIGKIIGYKIASMEVVKKTMSLLSVVQGRLKGQNVAKNTREVDVQTTITSVIQQRKGRPSRSRSRQNRNRNAKQQKESATSSPGFKNALQPGEKASRYNTNLNAVQGKESVVKKSIQTKKMGHKDSKIHARTKRSSRLEFKSPRLRTRIAKQYPRQVEISQKMGSISKKHETVTKTIQLKSKRELSSSKSHDSIAKTPKRMMNGKNEGQGRMIKSRAGYLNGKCCRDNKKLTLEVKTKMSEDLAQQKQSRKSLGKDWPVLTEDHTVLRSARDVSTIKITEKQITNKSPPKSPRRRRYADVAAGSSKNDNIGTEQKQTYIPATLKTWATVAKGTKGNEMAENQIDKRRGHKSPKMMGSSSREDSSSYPHDFPSLEEQRGKKLRKEKCRTEKIQTNNTKATGKTYSSVLYRKFYGNNKSPPILDKSKRKSKKRRNKDSKLKAKLTNKKDKDDDEVSLNSPEWENSSNGSWYNIDNMQEVFTPPVGLAVPLHGMTMKGKTVKGKTRCVSFGTSVQMKKENDVRPKVDICNQLNAMSVGSSSDPISPLSLKHKRKRTDVTSSNTLRNSKTSDVFKAKREDRGVSPKKISTRYRALLRRDHGKIDAKTATELFNRDRWIESHQKDKIFERFDHQQQRRKQTKVNDAVCLGTDKSRPDRGQDDPAEGTSHSTVSNQNAIIVYHMTLAAQLCNSQNNL